MREIRFRGWCEKDSEWRHGFYITDGNIHEINTMLKNGEFYASQVDANSVGQYIGLKDVNNVEIYEGDIVKFRSQKHKKHIIGIVEYICAEFRISHDYGNPLISGDVYDEKVIGNIHENPELLS